MELVRVYRASEDFPEMEVFSGFTSDVIGTVERIVKERFVEEGIPFLPQEMNVLDELGGKIVKLFGGDIKNEKGKILGRYVIGQ